MIPASYLYKDAFDQHWGRDFARNSGEAEWEAHPNAGQWERPSLFRTVRDFVTLAFAPTHRDRPVVAVPSCPEGIDCPPVPA